MSTLAAFLNLCPRIHSLDPAPLCPGIPFTQLAAYFAHQPGTVVLLSGGTLDCARYHLLAADPWLTCISHGRQVAVRLPDTALTVDMNPLDALEAVRSAFALSAPPECADPVASGLFGYLSYDLKDHIETLPRTCIPHGLPDVYMVSPSILVVQDTHTGDTTLWSPVFSGEGAETLNTFVRRHRQRLMDSAARLKEMDPGGPGPQARKKDGIAPPLPAMPFAIDSRGFQSNVTRREYLAAVDTIIDYIRAGDIYQVNLSQRYEAGFKGDPYALFLSLYRKNPAPFFSFVHAGDHQVVSTSPERFIQQKGSALETRPIKGTFPRGTTPEADAQMAAQLLGSQKDDAELSMIVDLMRNDLGRVARGGTVQVKTHRRLEPYDNVFHLVSIVTAELAPGHSAVDVIRATFPGGSITGCPKIRSMEIIDELESIQRHVYTGSVGYISFHDTMDLSIAIRTATVTGQRINYSVGGGIVFDSRPEKEYEETQHKGRTLMETLPREKPGLDPPPPAMAWVNGKVVPRADVRLAVDSPAAQYGAGIFETIRVDRGRPCLVPAHISRFNASWRTLFKTPPPDFTWEAIICHLVHQNGLNRQVAAVKIMGIPGAGRPADPHPCRDFLAVFARSYTHRLAGTGRPGLRLVTYPYTRHTPLAAHKTMNYFYYDLAGRHAGEHGGDEALILNADGSVSETHTCSILVLSGRRVYLPRSDYALPGVTVARVLAGLQKEGMGVVEKKMTPRQMCDLGMIFAANALMGVVPVMALDGRSLAVDLSLCRHLNTLLRDHDGIDRVGAHGNG